MKLLIGFSLSVLSVLLLSQAHSPRHQGEQVGRPIIAANARIPVVVELFTSEGCSSCPPADALLAELDARQPVDGAQIIAIEEHVDYWNHLGWADPFSSSEWTDRQQDYGAALRSEQYTPQMIVGGQYELVGGRSDSAVRAIAQARQLANVHVTIERKAGKDPAEPVFALSVTAPAEPSAKDAAEIWLAATEGGLASQVSRGENAGRTLRHAPVLRALHFVGTLHGERAAAPFQREVPVKLRPEWNRQNLSVIVFVQEKKSRHILGAAAEKVSD